MSEVTQADLDFETRSRAEWAAREKRDALLLETDVWGLSDYPRTSAQTDYRQALRDLSAQSEFPHNITWPTKPE